MLSARPMVPLIPLATVLIIAGCDGGADVELEVSICDSCAVELRPEVTLNFSDAPFSPSMFANVERLSDGTFALVDWPRGVPEILHFSAAGNYMDSHLRMGEGPGELVQPQALLAVGDSLWVLDSELARCTVLDSEFQPLRTFHCTGSPADAAFLDGSLYLTGFGPMGLVENRGEDGASSKAKTEGAPVPVSDDYATVAAGPDGVWYVAHPNQYRLTYWRPGEEQSSKIIERAPVWWQPEERFLMDRGPGGRPFENAEDRQVMSGPLLFGIGVSDGFVWTASYVFVRSNRQYGDFLNDWLDQGLQGDVRVFIEALTPEGQLVASATRDDLAPPRFTSDGMMYTLDKEGHGTSITLYQPKVVVAR